ncbi:hypothetical protein Tco_0269240 [Tanacetum coccineum]
MDNMLLLYDLLLHVECDIGVIVYSCRQDLGFIPSDNVVLSSTYVGKILGADQLLVILCYRYQESGIGYWILSMTISGSGVTFLPSEHDGNKIERSGVGVRTYLLDGAIDGGEANGIFRDPNTRSDANLRRLVSFDVFRKARGVERLQELQGEGWFEWIWKHAWKKEEKVIAGTSRQLKVLMKDCMTNVVNYRWLSMKKVIASCGSKYLAYLEVEVEYQGSSGLLLQPELPEYKWERITKDIVVKLPSVIILWAVTGDVELNGSNLVQETTNKIVVMEGRRLFVRFCEAFVDLKLAIRQDLGFIPSGNVVLSSTYVGKILGADQLLVILCYRYQESGIGYWILSMTISGSGLLYLDSTFFPDLSIIRHRPAIRSWNTQMMRKRIMMETSKGCLGNLEHHGDFDPDEDQNGPYQLVHVKFEISSWRGARVGVRTYLLDGAIDGGEVNSIDGFEYEKSYSYLRPLFVKGTIKFCGPRVNNIDSVAKVRRDSKRDPEFTWKRKDQMRSKCPQLLVDTANASSSELNGAKIERFLVLRPRFRLGGLEIKKSRHRVVHELEIETEEKEDDLWICVPSIPKPRRKIVLKRFTFKVLSKNVGDVGRDDTFLTEICLSDIISRSQHARRHPVCRVPDTRPPCMIEQNFESCNNVYLRYCTVHKSIRARVLNALSAEEKGNDIWENMKMILEGSELTKDDRESQLYDEFEHFRQNKGETIQGYYVSKPISATTYGLGHLARNSKAKATSRFNYIQGQDATMQAYRVCKYMEEEQSLFLGGEQVTNVDDDVDDSPENDLALNVDHVFEADECDAFDSDVDEGPTTQTMFMANLTSEDSIYDEAGPSYDSNNPCEVQDHDTFVDRMNEYHEVHEMQNDVQHHYVVDSDADYTSDSNIIPYDQYVEDNEEQLKSDSETSELARYKELVREYEKWAKFELTDRE